MQHTIQTRKRLRFYQPEISPDGALCRGQAGKDAAARRVAARADLNAAKVGKGKGKVGDLAAEEAALAAAERDAPDEIRPDAVAYEFTVMTHPRGNRTIGHLTLRPLIDVPAGKWAAIDQSVRLRLPDAVCERISAIVQQHIDTLE